MIQINPLQSYIDGGARAAITNPPSASLVFDLPGKAIWVKGVKLKGTDHTYTFSHDNYISITNTPDQNNQESEDIKIGINTTLLKQAIDTTYGIVNSTTNGLAPMFSNANKSAASAATTYSFLGITGTTLKWYQLPWRNVRINADATDVLGVNDTDPLIISSGNGIEVTWDSTNKKIVITNTKPHVSDNTDFQVSQYITSNNYDYRILFKRNANDDDETGTVRYAGTLLYNPSTKILKINGNKVITVADIYVGATSSTNATVGLVPAATSAQRAYFLKGDGTWANIATEMAAANTWRPIKVGGSERLGSGTDTGAVDFVAGAGITLGWDATNKRITITNSAPDVDHNTDRTGIKKSTVSGTKKTDTTLIVANSSSGLIFEGGTNLFKIGDGTNYVEIPVLPSFTVTDKSASILSTLTTLATIAGTDIKAKVVVEDKAATLTTASQTIATIAGVNITAKITNYNTDENVKQVDNNNEEWRPILTKNGTGTGTITSSTTFADNVAVYMNGNYLRANLFYTESNDITTTAITRVYCSNDGYIRYKTLAQFTSDIIAQAGLTTSTITKSLAPTTSWGATGIGTTDLATGTYAIQVVQGSHYYSGILSWYAASGGMAEEIDLHYNGSGTPTRIYLRTNNGQLQIAADAAYSSTSFTFNFRKLI